MSIDNINLRLEQLGIVLPPTPTPFANYVPAVLTGNLLYVSGQGPIAPDGTWLSGKVGRDVPQRTPISTPA